MTNKILQVARVILQVLKVILQILIDLVNGIVTLANNIAPKPDEASKQIIEMSKFKHHCDDSNNCEYCKKKWIRLHVIHALACFIVGILFNYAPQYIGTQENWIINKGDIGGYISLIPFAIGVYKLYCAYPRVFTQGNAFLLFLPTGAITFYGASRSVGSSKAKESFMEWSNVMSFGFLILTIMTIARISPRLMDWWEENKKDIKSFFKTKGILEFILGALAIGTALFQFVQVLLSLFQH